MVTSTTSVSSQLIVPISHDFSRLVSLNLALQRLWWHSTANEQIKDLYKLLQAKASAQRASQLLPSSAESRH